jgi:hypothetical protein
MAGLPARFWAEFSNATAIGFLPDRRTGPFYGLGMVYDAWTA